MLTIVWGVIGTVGVMLANVVLFALATDADE